MHSPSQENWSSSTLSGSAAADHVSTTSTEPTAALTAIAAFRAGLRRRRLGQSATKQTEGLAPGAVGRGQLVGQVEKVVPVAPADLPRVGEQRQLEDPAAHASPVAVRAEVRRAPSTAAVDRSRSTSSASAVSPAAVSR